MTQAPPVLIRYRQGRSQAVNRRFLSYFWVLAITFAVAAFYRPAIMAFTICLPFLVILWTLALRKAPRPGWILSISQSRMSLEGGPGMAVARQPAAKVRLRRRGSGAGAWTELLVLDGSGRTLFRVAVDEPDRERIAGALRTMGWPLES